MPARPPTSTAPSYRAAASRAAPAPSSRPDLDSRPGVLRTGARDAARQLQAWPRECRPSHRDHPAPLWQSSAARVPPSCASHSMPARMALSQAGSADMAGSPPPRPPRLTDRKTRSWISPDAQDRRAGNRYGWCERRCKTGRRMPDRARAGHDHIRPGPAYRSGSFNAYGDQATESNSGEPRQSPDALTLTPCLKEYEHAPCTRQSGLACTHRTACGSCTWLRSGAPLST